MPNSAGSNDHIAIVGLIIAVYGAIVATVNSTIQIINARRDRADVILKVRKNMTAVNSARYRNMKLTLVTATNRGTRPVTIQGFSTKLLDSHDEWMLGDIQPAIPRQITEGQEVTAFIDEGNLDKSLVERYYVWDSVGRNFKINIAPWYRRIWSKIRKKVAPVERVKRNDNA
jgi:hypothetical protein